MMGLLRTVIYKWEIRQDLTITTCELRDINRSFENFNYRKSIAYDGVPILLYCLG